MVTRRSALILVALLAAAYAAGSAQAAKPRVLVFTKTEGFRHESIPAAIQAVEQHEQADVVARLICTHTERHIASHCSNFSLEVDTKLIAW